MASITNKLILVLVLKINNATKTYIIVNKHSARTFFEVFFNRIQSMFN